MDVTYTVNVYFRVKKLIWDHLKVQQLTAVLISSVCVLLFQNEA